MRLYYSSVCFLAKFNTHSARYIGSIAFSLSSPRGIWYSDMIRRYSFLPYSGSSIGAALGIGSDSMPIVYQCARGIVRT